MRCGSSARVSWDGAGYHRVATVQEAWGLGLLDRVPEGEYTKILDAGCGSGRLTARLVRRFSRSRIFALDASPAMLGQAKKALRRFGPRVQLVSHDLNHAASWNDFNLIFSNAAFHWVLDHRRLFRNIHRWLAPGGLLVAQCGGRGNIRRVERLSEELGRMGRFREYFAGFRRPVNYAGVQATRSFLREAGFRSTDVWLQPAPTAFGSRASFEDFIGHVVCVPNLNRLPGRDLRRKYLDIFIETYMKRYGKPLMLDYVRLNITARKAP